MREYSFLFQHSKILIHNIFHLHSIFIAIQSGYPLNMSATLCSWFIFSYPFIINSLDCFRCYHYYRQQCENDQEITMMTKILQLVYRIQHYLVSAQFLPETRLLSHWGHDYNKSSVSNSSPTFLFAGYVWWLVYSSSLFDFWLFAEIVSKSSQPCNRCKLTVTLFYPCTWKIYLKLSSYVALGLIYLRDLWETEDSVALY